MLPYCPEVDGLLGGVGGIYSLPISPSIMQGVSSTPLHRRILRVRIELHHQYYNSLYWNYTFTFIYVIFYFITTYMVQSLASSSNLLMFAYFLFKMIICISDIWVFGNPYCFFGCDPLYLIFLNNSSLIPFFLTKFF